MTLMVLVMVLSPYGLEFVTYFMNFFVSLYMYIKIIHKEKILCKHIAGQTHL